MRTGYSWEGLEEPLQYVMKEVSLPYEFIDWEGEEEAENLLEELLLADRKLGFDLRKAPLLRIKVIRVDADRYYMLWSNHHIILDGWCTSLLLGDLLELYEGLKEGRGVRLRYREPYSKYIGWLGEQKQEEAEKFWKNYLQDLEEGSNLREVVGLKKGVDNGSHEQHYFTLSQEETKRLEEFASRERVTVNTVVQCCWAILLSRYLQKREVVFGVTVSGRSISLPGIEEMVGIFINTVPLRIEVCGGETVRKFLHRVQQLMAEVNEHGYLALSTIQTYPKLPADQDLFDNILVFENYPIDERIKTNKSDCIITGLQGYLKNKYGITLVVTPFKKMLFEIRYDKNYFDKKIIYTIEQSILFVLKQIVADTNQKILSLPVISDMEMKSIVKGDILQDYSVKNILQYILDRIEQYPDKIALIFEDKYLSYGNLGILSNKVASYLLQGMQVKENNTVILCLGRSIEFIVCLLGVLRSNALYMVIDRDTPTTRLDEMVLTSKAKLLICTQEDNKSFEKIECNVIDIKTLLSKSKTLSPLPILVTNSLFPLNIVFTSGSQGAAKGVVTTHQNIINRVRWLSKLISPSDEEIFCLQSTPVFVDSVAEIFFPLTRGLTLLIYGDKIARDALSLLNILQKIQVTHIGFTPSYFKSIINNYYYDLINTNLKSIQVSGEAFHYEDGVRYATQIGKIKLINRYGATESTGIYYQEYSTESKEVIHKTLFNTSMMILDNELHLLPYYIPGHLYISGDCVTQGYLDARITASRYIPNPYDKNQRIYITGDMARMLPDGSIEILGRTDRQIKIRGFRIDPSEIEQEIGKHKFISQVYVKAKEENNMISLEAYVYVKPEYMVKYSETIIEKELKNYLATGLPKYLIPDQFVFVTEMPLTSTGKVNWNKLSKPSSRVIKFDFSSKEERILFELWSNLLPSSLLSLDDDFFDLGGNSLLCIQLVGQAREKELDIQIRDIFEYPTLRLLAKKISISNKEEKVDIPEISRRNA